MNGSVLTIAAWVLVGIVAGFLAKAVPSSSDESKSSLGKPLLGILGAVVGGLAYQLLAGPAKMPGLLDTMSVVWSVIGAIAAMVIGFVLNSTNSSS